MSFAREARRVVHINSALSRSRRTCQTHISMWRCSHTTTTLTTHAHDSPRTWRGEIDSRLGNVAIVVLHHFVRVLKGCMRAVHRGSSQWNPAPGANDYVLEVGTYETDPANKLKSPNVFTQTTRGRPSYRWNTPNPGVYTVRYRTRNDCGLSGSENTTVVLR